ncbi:hypothetical protein Salat_0665400 [Sesamum alatum]|uniref:Uncharacterized protein n=1 Tax=Sesamum alatum TaxID=300844 RepID=A0AAE1YRQ2_9LAMI|nr:hypothetical protein Salat_0665400 [Sesamum alatum]
MRLRDNGIFDSVPKYLESGLEGENIGGEDSEIGIEGDELIESSEKEREDNLVDSEYGLSEDDCENLQQGPMKIFEHDNVNMLDEMNISDGEQLEDCESDELNSIPSDDEVESEHVRFYKFRPEIDLPDPQLRNGMIFTDVAQFKEGLLPAVYDLFPEVDANVPASASQGLTTNPPNTSAFTRANEPVMSPTPLSVKEPDARMGVGGVTLKSNFKKGGNEHVTLTSLQAVTRSRAQSTQQSSNAM